MVFNPDGFTNNTNRSSITPTQVKKPSARKSLCFFTNILYAKNKAAIRRVGAAKSKCKAIKLGTTLWEKKKSEKEIQKSMTR